MRLERGGGRGGDAEGPKVGHSTELGRLSEESGRVSTGLRRVPGERPIEWGRGMGGGGNGAAAGIGKLWLPNPERSDSTASPKYRTPISPAASHARSHTPPARRGCPAE